MSSRLLASILLLLAWANWAPAQSGCPGGGCPSSCPAGGSSAKRPALPTQPAVTCTMTERPPATVSQIVIIGNAVTPQNVILRQIPFGPGQVITYPDLRAAEANLEKLDIFENDPDGTGIRPTVEVLDPDGPVPVKDILVTVQEKCGAVCTADVEKPKCSCEKCSCCGCKNKEGAACSCAECKCCGCKTADTVGAAERLWVEECAGGAFRVEVQETRTGSLLFGLGVNSDAGLVCGVGLAEGGKCKCEGECKCCDCQSVAKEGTTPNCVCGECACCGCKAKKETKCGACGGEGCCCKEGQCACGQQGKCCPIEGCCWFTFGCPLCPATEPCKVGWLVFGEVCPAARLYTMCPFFHEKVDEVLQPCMKEFVTQYRQMFKCGKCAGCPAEADACADTAEPQAKKPGCGKGCGACAKMHVWQFHVGPFGVMSKPGTIRFFVGSGACEESAAAKDACPKSGDEAEKPTCPYLQKKAGEKKTPTAAQIFEQLGSPLENLAKLEQARHLCKKAAWLCERGAYDRAIHCYAKARELCPGSRWEVTAAEGIKVAQAMQAMDDAVRTATRKLLEQLLDEIINEAQTPVTAVEESEPATEPLPCQEPEAVRQYKQKFTELLDQAKCACAAGDAAQARELAQQAVNLVAPETAEKVQALLGQARACFTGGCEADGWEMLQQALMLDPDCAAAQELQEERLANEMRNRCKRADCERYETLPPDDEDAESSEPYDPCVPEEVPPGAGLLNGIPPIDARLIHAMERVLVRLNQDADGEEQEACFVIDGIEDDLELVPAPDADEEAGELKQQVRQLMDIIRQKICVDLDCGTPVTSGARLWVQLGNVEYVVTVDPQGEQLVRVKVSTPGAEDLKATQQANIEGILRWIEAGNGGEPATEPGDVEETEEPLYELETDLDPCW